MSTHQVSLGKSWKNVARLYEKVLGLLWALHFCKTSKVFIFNYGVWTKIESFFKWNMPLFFNGPCQVGIIDFLKEKNDIVVKTQFNVDWL